MPDGNTHFRELREKYPVFTYEKFLIEKSVEEIKLTYFFILSEGLVFKPTITIPKKNLNFVVDIDDERLKNIVFHIGMVELISYWKCTCSPKVVLKAGALNETQQKWWQKLFYKGLGEFLYINEINVNMHEFVNFENCNAEIYAKNEFNLKQENIIPIGGGKDSLVSLEILSALKDKNTCLILNPRGATIDSATLAGYNMNEVFEIERKIDPLLLELNSEGFLNGHTPFSALLAFICVLSAFLLGKKYIVLSNEDSANESNIENTDINHQYSKSFEFESDFNTYVKDFINDEVAYFSLLRPLTELQIARLFTQNKKYLSIFKSCNVGSKTNTWCGACSKCLFVYIMLSPFLKTHELTKIFAKELFADESLLYTFNQLIGIESVKPFDCVGTREEVNASLQMTIEKYQESKLPLPYLLKYYSEKIAKPVCDDAVSLLNHYNEENFLPKEHKELLYKSLAAFER